MPPECMDKARTGTAGGSNPTGHHPKATWIYVTWKELFAIVVAFHTWVLSGPAKRSCFILTTRPWWISGTGLYSCTSYHGFGLLIVFCVSCYNFNVCVTHVAGVHKDIADSLSRFQMDKFSRLAPRSKVLPDRIPAWPTQIFMTASCNTGIMALLNPHDKHTSEHSRNLSHSAVSTPLLQPHHHP